MAESLDLKDLDLAGRSSMFEARELVLLTSCDLKHLLAFADRILGGGYRSPRNSEYYRYAAPIE